jgi:hypothetical protein
MVADRNLSFEMPIAASVWAYIHFLSPEAAAHLSSSASTIHNWIIDAYATQKEIVVQQLHAASGLVHVTLDGWTSCNNCALLGVISHSL